MAPKQNEATIPVPHREIREVLTGGLPSILSVKAPRRINTMLAKENVTKPMTT
jgi:hypothetical protein